MAAGTTAGSGALVAGTALVLLPVAVLSLLIAVVVGVISAVQEAPGPFTGGLGDAYAVQHFGAMYKDAAAAFGVNAYVLMAIHESETDYGRSTLPGVRESVNSADCCAGPMQFSIIGQRSTWDSVKDAFRDPRVKLARPATYPNRHEPHPSVYDSYDSIYAAAKYLRQLGAGPAIDVRSFAALVRYKGVPPFSIPFAARDLQRAKELEAQAQQMESLSVPIVPGDNAVLFENGLAGTPENAPQAVKNMIAAANSISNKDYDMVHFPTHINNPTYDCSSSTSHVLWAGGKFGVAPWCSANFMNYGERHVPGDRRRHWVTVYAKGPCGGAGHVFLVIAGLRFDTGGPDHGPNAGEDGPRWRRGLRSDMADYVATHPEGL